MLEDYILYYINYDSNEKVGDDESPLLLTQVTSLPLTVPLTTTSFPEGEHFYSLDIRKADLSGITDS